MRKLKIIIVFVLAALLMLAACGKSPSTGSNAAETKELTLEEISRMHSGTASAEPQNQGTTPENTAGNKTENTAGNKTENTAVNKTENTAGNKTENTAGNKTENTAGNKTENTAGNKTENTAGNKTENTAGNTENTAENTETAVAKGTVLVKDLRIRQEPNTKAKILGNVEKDKTYDVYEIKGEGANRWLRIGKDRWISGNPEYVSVKNVQ